MHRRKFLELAGRTGVGLSVAGPMLAPKALHAAVVGEPEQSSSAAQGHQAADANALVLSLDGEWSIATDEGNVGKEQKWYLKRRADARSIRVPSIIQEAFPGYHGVVWYWRGFEAASNPYKKGRFLLRFHAVDYLADVWLNGVYLGQHEGGETPFLFDVTEAIRAGGSNDLSVRVLNPDDRRIDGLTLGETPHRNKFVKYTNGALPDYGGIIESCELLATPALHITDVFVRAEWKSGGVRIGVTLLSTLEKACHAVVSFHVTAGTIQQPILTDSADATVQPGLGEIHHEFAIPQHRLWDIDDPYLYRLAIEVHADEVDGAHEATTTFGFRDFRLVNGFFRLNNRRLFLKSTHTGNHSPYRMVSPPDRFPDMLRKDLLYAKASGFNTVRFISGVAHPYQLDLCDEIGLMVYEESSGSWLLKDSPQMKARYEDSMKQMILRDRNHPSIVLWGVLNETEDGPVFREAVSVLPFLRSLDETRLLLLSSGRFDGHLEIGSASNPGSRQWEYTWGKESPGAAKEPMKYPSAPDVGDFHLYPHVPQTQEVNTMMRTLGEGGKPIFLSEYGIGSMMNVIHEARMYEEAGIPSNAEDYVLVNSMAERFVADWKRFGMDTVYPFPETLLNKSQAAMARHRLAGFNAIRSNPHICGYNLTGMLDHAFTGEGIWRFWRDWKPGAFDAMRDGWAPVRWCLFVEPTHVYAGRPFTVEAVLANEDVLRSGEYAAHFELWGPNGSAWQRDIAVSVRSAPGPDEGPLAIPVLKEEVVLTGPEGTYEIVPDVERGIAPPETTWQFHLTDAALFPRLDQSLATWGITNEVESWLKSRGAAVSQFQNIVGGRRNLILVGDVSKDSQATEWWKLAEHMATGSSVLFLSPQAFKRDKEAAAWLPLARKGRVYEFNDWLYHKECVAKHHPVFDGLQGPGLLDWYFYGPTLPHYVFDGQDTPTEVIAASFAAGYSTPGGYASGILLGSYKFGAGQFFVNSFSILDHVDQHPAADRLLLNLIRYAGAASREPALPLPANFPSLLKEIGFAS